MAEVIKGSTVARSTSSPRVSTFNFDDMNQRAETYLQQVRQEAAKLITEAKAEAEKIKLAAQQEGRQAALQVAENTLRKQVEEQLNRVLPALESAAAQILAVNAKNLEHWSKQWEQQLVLLATAIAGRVVRHELQSKPAEQITLKWIHEALELGASCRSLAIHLHPDDIAILKDRVHEITQRLARLGPIPVVPDTTVSRGGCRVHSEFGVIDQTVEAQLARILEELK